MECAKTQPTPHPIDHLPTLKPLRWFLTNGKLDGSAVCFPSNFTFPHEILPVTKGTRYALVTWPLMQREMGR